MGFCDALKSARSAARISQHALAEKSGVSQQGISLIESGERSPTEETMQLLAAALGMELADMLRPGGDSPPHVDLTPGEQQLLRYYRQLSPHGQEVAVGVVQSLAENPAMLPAQKAANTA